MDPIVAFDLAFRGELVDMDLHESDDGSGYSTPMTPISVDFPSMTPTVTSLDSHSKRQRTTSTGSFDVVDDGEPDFQQIWDSLTAEQIILGTSEAIIVNGRRQSSRSKPIKPPRSQKKGASETSRHQRKRMSSPIKAKVGRPVLEMTKNSPVPHGVFPQRYTAEQRKVKVARFVEKRKRRVWKKEIKYSCRKQFAESRPRIAGRFIPKTPNPTLQTPTLAREHEISGPIRIREDPMVTFLSLD